MQKEAKILESVFVVVVPSRFIFIFSLLFYLEIALTQPFFMITPLSSSEILSWGVYLIHKLIR